MTYPVSLVAALSLAVMATDGALARSGAQAPTPFALDEILAYPFPENLTASSTGAAIAWTLNERGVRNIYLADGPEFRPRRLTSYADDDGRELASLSFSDDGRYRDALSEAAAVTKGRRRRCGPSRSRTGS